MKAQPAGPSGLAPDRALRFILLLGLVSLLADATYEGARSITGPFLAVLGASGAVVGTVAGLGELLGYGLRLVSGVIADRTRRYWILMIGGYFLNLLVVPLLALAGRWETAAALILAERIGKAVRTPARDAMLSHAVSQVGGGWGFGLHEALDQMGATAGPLLVAAVVRAQGEYRTAFAWLAIPAVLALLVLAAARHFYPQPRELEAAPRGIQTKGLPRAYWIHVGATALVAAGYADFPLMAYHFERTGLVTPQAIALLYALAMAVDAAAALVLGRLFDRFGLVVLAVTAAVCAVFAPLVFLGGPGAVVAGMVLWGAGLGAQESVLRAAVGGMAPAGVRGTAYGIFNAGYGVFWFAGSALMGLLYDRSRAALVSFSMTVQLAAAPAFLLAGRRARA
ncbi:MAG: MFS transporter [Bryobacterales bacterium]|nr:MFS transporter [Bryobacterales bacterium]